jgi:hypothetical protein
MRKEDSDSTCCEICLSDKNNLPNRRRRVPAAGQECPQQQQKQEEATYCEILADLLKSRSQGLEQQLGKRDSLGFIYLLWF